MADPVESFVDHRTQKRIGLARNHWTVDIKRPRRTGMEALDAALYDQARLHSMDAYVCGEPHRRALAAIDTHRPDQWPSTNSARQSRRILPDSLVVGGVFSLGGNVSRRRCTRRIHGDQTYRCMVALAAWGMWVALVIALCSLALAWMYS